MGENIRTDNGIFCSAYKDDKTMLFYRMKIIKFFSSFCDSQNVMNVYLRIDELANSERYGRDYVFTTGDDYTHAIIVNTAMPSLSIPKERIIGISAEPPHFLGVSQEFIHYVQNHLSKYYIGDASGLPSAFIERYSYLPWHYSIPTSLLPKTKFMSIMVSFKNDAPGHRYRHEMVRHILSSHLPIDIYGNGCNEYVSTGDARVKGSFSHLEPYEEYQFHICIENFSLPDYFSEKITNALICNTIPIYYGCKHIDTYFPDSVISLTGNITEDMNTLESIVTCPAHYQKQMDAAYVKKTISIENIVDHFES